MCVWALTHTVRFDSTVYIMHEAPPDIMQAHNVIPIKPHQMLADEAEDIWSNFAFVADCWLQMAKRSKGKVLFFAFFACFLWDVSPALVHRLS